MIIGIMGAMPDEVDQLCARLENVTVEPYGGVEYHKGTLAGKQVVVCCAGMGKANAAATTQVLITKFGAEKIIFSGIAGNMTSKIGIGDVVIGKTVLYHDAQLDMICQNPPFLKEYTGDPALIAAAEAACADAGVKALVGKIATGDLFVGDSATKAAIEAKCAPDCVEMEGAAVSQIAAKNGVPCVILRAMSDNAVDGHQRQRSAAVTVGPLIEFRAEFRLVVAAVEHPRHKVVVHVVAAHLPLPRGHPVFGQVIACQRGRHLQLPYLAVGHDTAAQHTVHLTAAQLVVHHQAVVLPAAVGVLVHLRQAHILKHRPRTFDELPQVLLSPFIFHAFFPILYTGSSFPVLCLFTVEPFFMSSVRCENRFLSLTASHSIIPRRRDAYQQNAQFSKRFFTFPSN